MFAETLNFTHAAKKRNITQPALHKQIQTLGESLGVTLYFRDGRDLKLTGAGVTLARFSREFADRSQQLNRQLYETVAGSQVSLVAGRGSFLYLLGNALTSFTSRYPNGARLMVKDQRGTLDAIRSGEAHLGVTVLRELPRDLDARLLRDEPAQLIVSVEHPLADAKTLGLESLNGLPLICPKAPSLMRETIAGWLASNGMLFNPVLDAEGWELLMHFASLNLGAAVVNGCCRPPDGTVAIALPDLPTSSYYLVSHKIEFSFPELEWMRACISKDF